MARRKRGGGGLQLLGLGVLAALVLTTATRWVREHPGTAAAVAAAVCALGGLIGYLVLRERRLTAERLAERERNIATTDGLRGPDFEEWVARLMRRTGFRSVTVRGGAGDQGADITARAPDGRWTVVQCKRHHPGRPLGSPAVQTFAGPAHKIHKAELAVLIATTRFTAPARRDAALMEVVLIDRDRLAAWATDQVAPRELG
ncbi:hypothetical protein Afil01_07800 [Actinorhabdospora filicis]|uniref:Restriction endonuclease type IV Mrr domain-containing protein n=1 Tax=Actinorhabdospora filicis TaxID=1785913 RepID=A0A9W6SH96_9ACTN|nr:restriction endonuclease [Actinorhabdospora filicis]GLZ75973.1 hypothetical protein Afil01_07800 [Actinorhabdospora filicis]